MAIKKLLPKISLGARLSQTKVPSTKVDETITEVNRLTTESAASTAAIATINGFDATDVGKIKTAKVTLTATEIVGTAAGDIGHASGATLVAAPAAGFVHEFLQIFFVYDFGVAAYTGGAGDLVVAYGAGAAVTTAVTAANLLTAATDKLLRVGAIDTEVVPVAATALTLRGTAYTQPGTAAGVLRCYITYRTITTNL
jgi:hypothetical protein